MRSSRTWALAVDLIFSLPGSIESPDVFELRCFRGTSFLQQIILLHNTDLVNEREVPALVIDTVSI